MTTLPPDKRQNMHDLIEASAKLQKEELSWVGNLYKKRLKELQETEEQRRQWVKENEKEE